ncbi:MAG: hypothetical protein ACKPE1_15545, partial [Dolichospermum sp.]
KISDFTTNAWNKFTQGINGAKPKISDFTTNTWNKFTQGIDSAKPKISDFTTNTWNKFTQGIDKAKAFISQITWAGFVQKIDDAKTSVKNFGSNIWTGFTARIDAIKNSASNALIPIKALFDENQVVRQTARREWGSIISYGISKIGVALKALIPLALEAALALGVILFARG